MAEQTKDKAQHKREYNLERYYSMKTAKHELSAMKAAKQIAKHLKQEQGDPEDIIHGCLLRYCKKFEDVIEY